MNFDWRWFRPAAGALLLITAFSGCNKEDSRKEGSSATVGRTGQKPEREAKAEAEARPALTSGPTARAEDDRCLKVQGDLVERLKPQYAATEATIRAGTDPLSRRIAELSLHLSKAPASHRASTQLSIDLANAEHAKQEKLPSLIELAKVRCWPTQDRGFWAITVAQPLIVAPSVDGPSLWQVQGLTELIHSTSTGKQTQLVIGESEPGVEQIRRAEPLIVDVDNDGNQELVWEISDPYGAISVQLFTSDGERISREKHFPLPGRVVGIRSGDADHSAQLVYRVHFGEPPWCEDPNRETEYFPTYDSSDLLAEVVNGKIVLDSPLARQSVTQWCPAPPPKHWKTPEEVLCARLWGQSEAVLLRQIRSRFSAGKCRSSEIPELPLRGPSSVYAHLLVAARWHPPFQLDPNPATSTDAGCK